MSAEHLIVVAYAVAPGPGGPEGHVNTRLCEALAEHWPGGVSLVTGGEAAFSEHWRVFTGARLWELHSLGPEGAAGSAPPWRARLAAAGARPDARLIARLGARLAGRLHWWRVGYGLKQAGWEQAVRRVLTTLLERHPDATVYSRALPMVSIQAVAPVLRQRQTRWIVNINDPLPADVWPGLYVSHPHSDRRARVLLTRCLSRFDAVTFPCRRLRDIEMAAFPALAPLPQAILPHVARAPRGTGSAESATARGAPATETLRIAFAGTLRKTRICPALHAALADLAARRPDILDQTEFVFHLARPNPFAHEFIDALPVRKRVVLEEFDLALDAALLEADLLLDLEADADRPLLLTKVANFIGLGKPVLALCAPDGTTWDLVRRQGWGYAADRSAPAAVVTALEQAHGDWASGRLVGRSPAPALRERFSGARAAADLAELCAALRARRPPELETAWP